MRLVITAFLAFPQIGLTANTNPTILFQTSRTNSTNLVGRPFSLFLYTLSDYTNVTNVALSRSISATNTNISTNNTVTNQISVTTTRTYTNSRTFSNDIVQIGASFTNPLVNSNLTSLSGTNGLIFSPSEGRLFGIPTTNFVLNISNLGLVVTTTNLTWTTTNLQTVVSNVTVTTKTNITTNSTNVTISTNITLSFTNASATSTISTSTFTNTNTSAYRFVFQSVPTIAFTNVFTNPANVFVTNTLTNIRVGSTYQLPSIFTTNGTNLSLVYTNIVGPATYNPGNSNFVVNGPGRVFLRVNVNTTNISELWTAATASFTMEATNDPPSPSFGMQSVETTNTNSPATNLPYLGQSRLLFSNQPSNSILQLALDRPGVGRFLLVTNTNVTPAALATNFQALAGTGNATITAVLLPTATSGYATSRVTIALTPATNRVIWRGAFSNTNSITISNPAVTNLTLEAVATSGGLVGFSSASTNVAISGSNVKLLANNTSSVITATPLPADPNLWVAASSNVSLVVNWAIPPVPAWPTNAAANRQDGVAGQIYRHVLSATGATNYQATNLPPGLSFDGTNLITGTNQQPGLYRMTLVASTASGSRTNTNGFYAAFTPSNIPSQTSPWSYTLNLGLGTNTNGTYLFSTNGTNSASWTNATNFSATNLPNGIGVLSNVPSGGVTLTNSNSSFAGLYTNLCVWFSNSAFSVQTNFTLQILPQAPALTYTSALSGTQGAAFSNAPSAITAANIPGYPLEVRSSGLPLGLRIDSTNGLISGVPTVAGVFQARIWATNVSGNSATNIVTFTVAPASVAGQFLQISLAGLFSNAVGTYQAGGLPPGLSMLPQNGFINGIPQAVGTFVLPLTFTSTNGSTASNNFTLVISAPAPRLRLPASVVTATTSAPVLVQPWVTGPGWSWGGADPLTNFLATRGLWDNRYQSNANGILEFTRSGLAYSNQLTAGTNALALLWRTNLPASAPWLAQARVRITNLAVQTNASVEAFLGIFPAPASISNVADVFLLATHGGQQVGGEVTNSAVSGLSNPVGREVFLRLQYAGSAGSLTLAANTNTLGTNFTFTNLLAASTNLRTAWAVTNDWNSFRLWLGGSSSNQVVTNRGVVLRDFCLLPGGLTFSATGLPPGLAIDPVAGTISGQATAKGNFSAIIRVTNSQGSSSSGLRFVIR